MRAKEKSHLFGILVTLLALLTKSVAGVICEICNKDFISLGRQLRVIQQELHKSMKTFKPVINHNHLL